MKTRDQTLEEILGLAATHFRIARAELSPEDDLFEKLGIDSLKALELLTRIEQHFDVELPDHEMQGVSDFRALADRVHARL
jgi:acyl carrier protein